jgi:hypothetical protein
MLHHSKFPLFAFLALLCAAGSGCSSTHLLSSDPQTAEDILQESTEHGAHVTLMNGDTVNCFAFAVRKDSTHWQLIKSGLEALGPQVSVSTDSIFSIRIAYPKAISGMVSGASVGAFAGWVIGLVSGLAPNPLWNLIFNFQSALGSSLVGGVCGLVVGGIIGGIIGAADDGTVWKGGGTWDSTHDQWIYPSIDSLHTRETTQTKLPH